MRAKSIDFAECTTVRAWLDRAPSQDCYTALGVVHNLWTADPQEFDDYLSRQGQLYSRCYRVLGRAAGRCSADPPERCTSSLILRRRVMAIQGEGQGVEGVLQKVAFLPAARVRDEVRAKNRDRRRHYVSPAGPRHRPPRLPPGDFAYSLHSASALAAAARGSTGIWKLDTKAVAIVPARRDRHSQDRPAVAELVNPERGFARSARARHKILQCFQRQGGPSPTSRPPGAPRGESCGAKAICTSTRSACGELARQARRDVRRGRTRRGDLRATQVALRGAPRRSRPSHKENRLRKASMRVFGMRGLATQLAKCSSRAAESYPRCS